MDFSITANFIDLELNTISVKKITVQDQKIAAIEHSNEQAEPYVLPGFVDAHVHIESSMLPPSEFARMAVAHGTVATVSDPHEIANVLGKNGVDFMIESASRSPFYFHFGVPSCVPATSFETAGATLDAKEVGELLEREDLSYLAEMMNYPGVLTRDKEVMEKIRLAQQKGKPIDGHAPGLTGEDAISYFSAGITTDHECFTLEEARFKAQHNIKILIREGSAAKNFEELIPILKEFPNQVMFCCDDKHPDGLLVSHIDGHVKRAMAKGYDPMDILRAACLNPYQHYKMKQGMLKVGDPADFIVIDRLHPEFKIMQVYLQGSKVAEHGKSLLPFEKNGTPNFFQREAIDEKDLKIEAQGNKHVRVIEALDGQLISHEQEALLEPKEGFLESDPKHDLLKMVVVNRYDTSSPPALAFIKGFGMTKGAIAGSVAHDSHNIIAVGVEDKSLVSAINEVISRKGGLSVCTSEGKTSILPLPIAGLMSDEDGYEVAQAYIALEKEAKSLGSTLRSPFMTLSFMALLVIPDLKLSDKGLFSGKTFSFAPLIKEN